MKSDCPRETRMISYAQNFEDVILHRVFRDRPNGFYIDVGAMDPTIESVTKVFYDEGWSGINIEPNEWFYGKLLAERPRDINLNLAVGEREESKELYMFQHIGNSTFEESSRDRYVGRGFEANATRVTVTTLAAVCHDYVRRPIDFLKIDCEGWEKFVIRGADWDRFRPSVVVVEATIPGTSIASWSEWEPQLEGARYEMVYFDGLNRFYLRRESADLRLHFELPPNFFDDFQVYATINAEREREGLARQVAELENKLNSAATEHVRLAKLVESKENELRGTRAALEEAEQARDAAGQMSQALRQERDGLARQIAELQAQAQRDHDRIAQLESEGRKLETQAAQLDQVLLKTRLWVGQLSQDLAASKQRQ